MPNLKELIERLERAEGPDACWFLPRKTDSKGRVRVWTNGKIELAHRAVWKFMRGEIPVGKMLCHHCDNAGCVNPSHIYVGTHADNMRDMAERKRSHFAQKPEVARDAGRRLGKSNTWTRGDLNPKAKLTQEQVLSIRNDKRPTKVLCAQYAVARTTIQRIRNGSQWAALRARSSMGE